MDNLCNMIDVDASECTVDADKVREMAIVHQLEGGSKGVNALVAGVVVGAIHSIISNILEIDAFVCNEPESFRALNIPLGCRGEARLLAFRVLTAACAGGRESIVQELLFKWSVKEDDDQNKEGETKLNDSMKKEKEKKRKWLIKLIDDTTVLWTASSAGHVGVVEKILEVVGINVNVLSFGDGTPLCAASQHGHLAIVKVLIKAGCNVNQAIPNGSTPLYQANSNDHLAIVKVLINAGGNVDQARTTDGSSPLYVASLKGNVDLVKVLIKAGGHVNHATNDGCTPLMMASSEGKVEVVRLLLQQSNIDMNQTSGGMSALGADTMNNHTEIIQLLTEFKYKDIPLIKASHNGDIDAVRRLLKQPDIDINQKIEGTRSARDIATLPEIKDLIAKEKNKRKDQEQIKIEEPAGCSQFFVLLALVAVFSAILFG